MSAVRAVRTPSALDLPSPVPARVRLRLVAPLAPERVGRGAFTMLAVGVLALGLLAILVVNTTVAQGGFALVELRTEQAKLAEQRQALEASIALAAAPASLEASAIALGMVRMKSPAFLRVSDGKVLGKAAVIKPRRGESPRTVLPESAALQAASQPAPAIDADAG